MFYSISGKVVLKQNNLAVIENNGIAFAVHTTNTTLSKLKDEATLFTYLQVREDAMDLYGFHSLSELNTFKMLISVSGIGAKAATAILSDMTAEDFALTVVSEDSKSLTGVKGIGAKTAQRIILELKDKLAKTDLGGNTTAYNVVNSSVTEALAALSVLGYVQSEVAPIVSKMDRNLSSAEIIKETLKIIGSKK
ncbi:MAG: Holliday junction branch migration protein RuvA [Oscillospiraceae bacterium]|jgi:Holliday junction DNA helicase RuvA|nr:Holliday junction branch migration protein RuvA [Oscillospiraceae bacterium]